MALLWIDGFEWETPTVVLPSGGTGTPALYSYEARRITNDTDIVPGRAGGAAIELFDNDYIEKWIDNTNATLIIGASFKFQDFDSNEDWLGLYDEGDANVRIRFDDNTMEIRAGSSLEYTGPIPAHQSRWLHMEIKSVIHDSTGSVEIKVNGSTIVNETGLDTNHGANGYITRVRFSGQNQSGLGVTIDDLWICNGAGSANNDFLGALAVQTLRPDGAGNSSDWTAYPGSNYQNVDDDPDDDGDSTINESGTTGDLDLYTYENTTLDTINGVQINSIVRETDASPFSVHNMVRSGVTDYEGAEQAIGGTDYVNIYEIEEVDPDTSSAWTDTGLNAAEFGIKVA